jgi:hypothetical protein
MRQHRHLASAHGTRLRRRLQPPADDLQPGVERRTGGFGPSPFWLRTFPVDARAAWRASAGSRPDAWARLAAGCGRPCRWDWAVCGWLRLIAGWLLAFPVNACADWRAPAGARTGASGPRAAGCRRVCRQRWTIHIPLRTFPVDAGADSHAWAGRVQVPAAAPRLGVEGCTGSVGRSTSHI